MSPTSTSAATLASCLPAAIVETTLTGLAPLFLDAAAGDIAAARDAVAQMLAAHHPETVDELRLAANIVGFGFHALQALGQSATPDMPLTRILRLRGSAVSLSRESQKAERRLEQLQRARRQGLPAQFAETRPEPAQPEPAQPEPAQAAAKIARALDLIEDTAKTTIIAKTSNLTWTQAYEQRQRDLRVAARLKRAEAIAAAKASPAAPGQIPGPGAPGQAP